MANALEIVQAYKNATAADDWKAARRLLHDDLSFEGPFDKFDRPEPYLEALQRLHPIVERADIKKIFVEGDDVCVLYDLVTNSPAGTAFIAEWLRVRGGKIAAIRAVFDARPFAAMFAKT